MKSSDIVEISLFVIAALSVVWALWVRRGTWRYFFESAATASVLMCGLTMVLALPWTADTVGGALYWLTGQWNLNSWMSNICCLGATCAFILHMLMRHGDIAWARREFHRRVNLPVTFAVPVMLALLCRSTVSDAPHDDLVTVRGGFWFISYWLVFLATSLYLHIYLFTLLFNLRTDDRSRHLAYCYLAATVLAFVVIALRAGTLLFDQDDPDNIVLLWAFGALCITVYCIGCGCSWLSKTRDARKAQRMAERQERQQYSKLREFGC